MGILTLISHVQVEGGGRDTSKGGGLTDRKQEAECWRKIAESCTDIDISEKGGGRIRNTPERKTVRGHSIRSL